MHVPDEWLPRKFSCHTKPGLQTDWFYFLPEFVSPVEQVTLFRSL